MLLPLQYHEATARFFQQQSQVWQFFVSNNHKEGQLKAFKTDLLKNTYKFDETADAQLYQKVNLAKEKLDMSIPVTLYQAQHTEDMNASIVYINDEAHIVFSGKIITLLSEDEMLAIIAHELSHVKLYTHLNGDVEVADRIVTAIGNHPGSTPAHYETARLFKLYTEIFCDRGAYIVTGNYAPIISSLVKISTGLQSVNADSYIKQAEEIFSVDAETKTTGVSHPENFIRARAIWLWHMKGHDAEPIIKQMIEGNINLDELDLFRQQQIATVTQQLIMLLLQPEWMQTAQTTALAKQYFGSIQLTEAPDITTLLAHVENVHSNLRDYLAYVLYDFATTDKTLEDVPLGYCFYLADDLKLDKPFAQAVKKERKLSDKKVTVLKKQTLAEFHKQQLQPTVN
ncbi:M48 family metalloprotease [Panacibacter ginsenosidivorans]|uniref:M48 family metalloprotease n=1 Tax=Panacibacter ginsenosidivorans TaxID=1813871 RepID=A0A5B8VG98_9BACT|nr:M48 family metalloprotease [Panacibacter ginsenosidivorans]QEC69328.1 M48 family metalloprotease [Panacibacter ginsenosidivorans]